ncbi:DUF3791 domain-containing protein [Oribacterium parvum]|uniref:DUF3791 domain-containing protein n=1 Tax=Oribacterium parvum TaxID=1501329 RepID=UPI0028E2D870|nr:DUF3791 domain-containing protein [Oribacterium parvum]
MSELKKKINYTVACVNEFAKKFEITSKEAFQYLEKYKGILFLKEHYEIEHTLSLEDTIEDLSRVCRANGGEY